jgi:hypothetical protein
MGPGIVLATDYAFRTFTEHTRLAVTARLMFSLAEDIALHFG